MKIDRFQQKTFQQNFYDETRNFEMKYHLFDLS